MFHIEVVAHRIDGDGLFYDDHIFTVDIRCESIYYFVERSYVDFLELHQRLSLKFPHSEIPPLPLSSFATVPMPSAGKSLLSNEARKKIPIPENAIAEDLTNKKFKLQLYLRTLLTYREVAASTEFISFLDEEIKCNGGRVVPKGEISEIDLLLVVPNTSPLISLALTCASQMSTPAVTTTVKGTDLVVLDVSAGQVILWKFFVDHYDIGFSVDMDEDIKVIA